MELDGAQGATGGAVTGESETPQASPKTYTEKELNDLVAARMSQRAWEVKKIEEREAAAAKKEAELKAWQTEREQAKAEAEKAELDAVLADPDATEGEKRRAIKAKEWLDKKIKEISDKAKAEAELDKRLTEKAEKLKRVELLERDEKLEALAAEKHVDLVALKKAADKITDPAQLAEIVDLLPKVVKEAPKVDSGKSMGGGGKPSITAMSNKELTKFLEQHKGKSALDLIREGIAKP